MTRKEYESVYGSQPTFTRASALDDEQPAPIRMTREEYNQMYYPKAQTFTQDAQTDINETKQAVLNTAERGAQRSGEISQRVATGETSKAKGLFQKFGTALASTGNMVLDVGIGAAKAILPQKAEDSVSSFFKGLGEVVTDKNADFYKKEVLPDLQSNDPDKQASAKFIVETLDAYKNDPNFKADVDAAGGIVGALLSTKVKDGVSGSLDTAFDTSKAAINSAKKVVVPTFKTVDNKNVVNVANEIAKIEDKYVKTRNANNYSKDVEASRTRIAQSNVLDGSVDNDGVIRTKGTGGAIDQYKAQTIDGVEDIVRRSLKESKETIQFDEVRKALIKELSSSGLEGADLVAALKKVNAELAGLQLRTKGSSIIDLSYLHDAKVATTKNINYMTPPEKATYRKAIARAYKTLVENNSKKVDVKQINQSLAQYYEDIARLERLDGARAEGGRLGKYTASLVGTGIGMAAGSVGGGVGAAVGGVIGGELAQSIKGAGMSRTFKGGGTGLPKDAVLETARLKIPDKVIKANPKIPKTKEITALEDQIAKNVTEQKNAIKAKDYELVSALKEVYTVLADDLEQISRKVLEVEK